MKIIGHRGARTLALENSLDSLKTALQVGVDGVEFDIRSTKDCKFILSHDPDLLRVTGVYMDIDSNTLEELMQVPLLNGEKICTLSSALKILKGSTAYIECKGENWAMNLAKTLPTLNQQSLIIISFNIPELLAFHAMLPDISCYPITKSRPFKTLQLAKFNKLTGVDLKWWLINPLTYAYARRNNLELVTYTVNSRLLIRVMSWLYPQMIITTDEPQKLQRYRTS